MFEGMNRILLVGILHTCLLTDFLMNILNFLDLDPQFHTLGKCLLYVGM